MKQLLTLFLILATLPVSHLSAQDLSIFDLGARTRFPVNSPTLAPANLESSHVHPIDLSPNDRWLVAANTYAGKVEIFEVKGGNPEHHKAIFTGLDPISVRFRNDEELWVVNHLSDSISILEMPTGQLKRLVPTHDEPADVVFSEASKKAFVTCSQVNELLAYDLTDLEAEPEVISIKGEEPRALTISPDGRYVFAAVFESGNASTVIGGGRATDDMLAYPPNIVNDARGPYQGVNPPPNDGDKLTPDRLFPPKTQPVSLIVKKDPKGRWMDDNKGDWTSFVSGDLASESGRIPGWDLPDRDIAILDTQKSQVTYARSLMNICMAICVNPADGSVSLVGTDATNEIRFEPELRGSFVRVKQATIRLKEDGSVETLSNKDLNPHLDYTKATVPQATRDLSIGDPRAIVQTRAGRAYVAGMGSNNLIVTGQYGDRLLGGGTIEVGEGPTGLALNGNEDRLYVLNRFEGSISVVNTSTDSVIDTVTYEDPTPTVITVGRKHLYDTHKNSGLGQASCGSCHVDGRMDRLAWDLGDPSKSSKSVNRSVDQPSGIFKTKKVQFSSVKGPMVTQTLQGIIGNGPFHWRGEMDTFEDFNATFETLLGDDTQLTDEEMVEFKAYVDTITFPPNPYRETDHTMPKKVALPNQFTTVDGERIALPDGNPERGAELFNSTRLDHFSGRRCSSCHQSNAGGYGTSTPAVSELVSLTQQEFKPSQLRNVYEKIGFDAGAKESLSGFGYLHDGTIDTLTRYLSQPQFEEASSPQQVADTIAFLYTMNGANVPANIDMTNIDIAGQLILINPSALMLLFNRSPDALAEIMHAGTGKQVQLIGNTFPDFGVISALRHLSIVNDSNGSLEAILHATIDGEQRAWRYDPQSELFQSGQRNEPMLRITTLLAQDNISDATLTLVHPNIASAFIGDTDGDGLFDHEETMDLDPTLAGVQNPFDPFNADSTGNNERSTRDFNIDGMNDFDGDGVSNADEFAAGTPVIPLREPFPINLRQIDERLSISWESLPGRTYTIESSLDLTTWKTHLEVGTASPGQTEMEWEANEWTTRFQQGRYFRVRQHSR